MADNWKNSILPGPGSLDLGSLEYDDETSLEGITQKYQDLGRQVSGLTKAAADDVSARQVKLIGNDFGGVNPMMYATYYQPEANDAQSAMRVKGTEKALEEGMERGKAAAEADLNAAKNTYNNAMDGYNSAKEAFANIKVAMTESGMLPDNTDETEAQNYNAYPTDRAKANFLDTHEYINDQNIDWSNEQRWSDAVNKTIADRGVDTSNWSQADWDNFWTNDEVGRAFEKNYVSNAIRQDMGEDAYNRFMASYDEVINRSNAVFDYINLISDKLPDTSLELFYVGDAPIKKEIGNDNNLGTTFTRDTSANQVAEYRKESWINENIAEQHREDVKKFAQQQKDEFNEAWGQNTSVQGLDALQAKQEQMARDYLDYISDKVINFEQESEAKPELTTQLKELNETLKEIYGFDTMDMTWMTTWKKQNPDEFQRYQNQLAMAYGKMDAIEVADGEKWYYTGCKENNGYEQLPAGTPVFFAPDGALNDDGSFRSDKLKTFIDMWKDYYSADVTKISEEELTNRQTALQDAYKAYMEETSAVAMVNSLFNSPITPDVYNSVIACFEDPGTSDKEIFGEKVSDYVKEFKEYSEKDPDAALRYLYGLTNAAYSKSKSFMRYNGVAKQLTFENLNYGEDSDVGDESKFQWNQGGFKVPEFDPEDQSQAVAAFLVLTRSMEKYRAGSEQYNINPDFMRENSMTNIAKSWGSQAMGAIDFAASVVNLLTGTVAAPFNGWQNPAENGGGMSFANVVGSIFTGEREYDKDSAWQQGELNMQLDDKAREYAKSLVNPLLIDVYFGDKDFGDVTGVAENLMLEGKNFWESPYAFGNFVVDMSGMIAVNVAEGKAIGVAAEGIGAMATRAQLKLLPAITEYKAIKKGLDTVGKGANWVDNIDDPYLAAQTARNTLNIADDVPAAMEAAKETAEATAQAASHLDDFQTGSTGYKILSTADDYYTGAINFVDEADDFGLLNRRAANALSSLDSNNLDDLVQLYGESTRKVINALDKVKDTSGLSDDVQRSIRNFQAMNNQKIVLASGETVSLAEASLTVAANRIMGVTTLSSATGISARELAQLPDQARSFLLRTLKGISSSDDGLVVNGSLDMFLRTMGPSDFKAMAQDFLERAVFNNTIGKTWDKFDTYRALGAAGWKRSGMYALGREFLTDALTDPLRDFKRNIQVPHLDDEGNMRVQTVGEYFTNPENLLQNLAFSSGHFLIRRLWNQYGAWHWNKEAHKAYNALDATADMKSEGAIAALKRANDAANMAQMYSDRAWKAGMNYGNVVKYTEESNAMLDKAFQEIFKTQGWDLEGFQTGGKGKKFKTSDEYIKYMTKDNMPTKEGMHALMTSLALKSMNNYVLIKHQMGFKFGEFGNLSDQNYLRIWDTMRKTINDNYSKFAGNGKDTMTNVHDFYQLIKADLISANDNGELGIKVRHFDKALDSYFGNLEAGAKDGLKSGMMLHPRYGYLPIASLYYDGTFDEMKASHENGAFRGLLQEGSVIEVTTANPFVERNYISFDGLIDAMLKGEKTYDIVDNSGKVIRTVTLDYDGLNPVDNMTVYSNTFNMHKYLDPLWGKNEQDFSIALQNGRAYIVGDDNIMTSKWQAELKKAKDAITGYDWIDKETKKKMHHEGFAETIASRAVKKGLLTEKQGKELQKNWIVETKIGEKAHKRFNDLNQKMKAASDAKNKALDVIQNGDLPKHVYPTVAEVFGFSKDSGADLAAEGEKIWKNGQRLAKYLVEKYTNGEITEDMGVVTIKTNALAKNTVNTYDGDITPDKDTVFVFGSNTEGRHGKGAAKLAKDKFGAKYGQSEGLQGNSYAIPTKNLKKGTRSVAMKDITQSIKKMYDVAKKNPDKQFKVAYRTDSNLSGYKLSEFATMFKYAGDAPENVVFSKELGALLSKEGGGSKKYNYKDLPVDAELISMLKDAGKNNGQITSDLVAWAAVEADIRTPYSKKTVAKDGTVSYDMVKGYQSKLMSYYNPKAEEPEGYVPQGRFYEVSTAGDKRFSALNARLKEGTKITVNGKELEVGGMTIEDAYQNVVKKSGKGRAPAKDSALNAGESAPAEVVIAKGTKDVEAKAKSVNGVNVLRQAGDEHYGNPFSTKKYRGVKKVVPTIDEAVRDYEAWLRGTDFQDIEPERRQWIVNQINSGALDGKKLVYYTEDVDGGDYFYNNSWKKSAEYNDANTDAITKANYEFVKANKNKYVVARDDELLPGAEKFYKEESMEQANQGSEYANYSPIEKMNLVRAENIEEANAKFLESQGKTVLNDLDMNKLLPGAEKYYTEPTYDEIYGKDVEDGLKNPLVTKYDAETAPNHAHILAKLVNERIANSRPSEGSVPKMPDDFGTTEYMNRTHTKEDFMYERYLQQRRLDNLQKTYDEWESNNWKKPLGGDDVRIKDEETRLSDLDRLNIEMDATKEVIANLNEQIGPEKTSVKGAFTKNDELPLKKIISGGQTGVDQMGLEIGQRLGYETGGTAAPKYQTEKGSSAKTLQKYGMTEITEKLQGGKKGKEFYLPRTEQNVKNSDGTVYFASDTDSAGKIATEHYAKQYGKPFLLNPTDKKLKQWIIDNNIETLNVAGNRGSKLGGLSSSVEDTLINALSKEGGSNKVGLENETYKKGYKPLWDAWAKQNPELIDELAVNSAGRVLNDKFATTNVSQARALTDILLESGKKDVRDLEATKVHESNKDIARSVTGDLNGMMEFGKRRFKDPKTGKIVEVGAESFDAAKLYGTEYRLARNDSGEIVVRSSEAKMAELEHAFTIQMYAALGVDYDQKAKMYKPDAFQQRYVESVIDRAKTELSDRGSFNGADFRDKLDEINSDRSLAKKWDEPIYTYKSGNRDVPVDCASFTKGLEKDNVVDAFRTYAQFLGVRARAGEFDGKLPDDVSADELARVATSVKALYDSAEYYGNRPKRMQELTEQVDEEGNVMEDQNMPTTRFVNDYGEIIDSNGYGEVIDELPLGGRMALDLSRKDLTQAIEDYQTFIKWYTKPDDPMYKIVHSKDLEEIHTARKTAVDNISDFANKLNDEAAKLYNRKRKINKEFNAMVDSAKMNAESRMEANPNANSNNLKFFYLEALGVAAPESELNSIGSGKYGQTTRRYYAAKAEQANGTPNTSVDTKGWSLELTDARVQAGESYAAHLKQIATGFERLQEMSGKSYQTTIDKINMIADNLPKELRTGRADFSDNAENSIMAMLGDLYDDARAEKVITNNEIEFAQRKASETVLRISDKIFGLDDVNSIKDPTNFASPYGEALAALLDAHDRLAKTRKLIESIDSSKEVVDENRSPVNAKEELQQRLIEDKNYYDEVIGTLWEKLGGDQDLGTFMRKINENIESIRTASDYYKDAYNNRPIAKGFGTNVPYSKQRGKESMFYQPQLAMQAGTVGSGYVADAVGFDMKTPKGMRRVEVEVDYGTGQDISETGAGARFMNTATQTEIDYTRFSEKEADIFFGAASEAMDDSSHGLAIVKNPTSDEEVLQTYTHGWCLVSRSKDPYEFTREQFSKGTKTYSADEVAEKAMADYAERTKDYKPQEEIEKAYKEIDKAAKEYDSNKKKADVEKDKVRKQSRNLDDMAKKVLNEEEYARYKAARERLTAVKDADPSKGGIYRPDDGSFTIISKKNHKLPSGTTTAKTLLEGLGYDSKNFNSDISEGRIYTESEIKADRKARKAMMKEVNENLRSGNVKKTRVQQYKNPSALDLKSQTMTINNILAFVSQCADRAKIDKAKLDPSQIVVAKDYADLLYRISREGIGPETFRQKAKGFAMHVTEWNKFIQNVQLAGGASYINALTIAQARGAIFSSPSMTWQYIKLVTDFKDDAAVQRFAVENSSRLVDIGMKVQDHTVFTDLQAAISETPGLSDGGSIASLADRIHTAFKNRKATERTRAEKYEFATKAIQDSTDSLFGDATFKRVLPVLRAKMLMANYDSAVRLIKNKFPNIDADSLDDAACKFAYARTTAFFEPNKTTSGLFKSRRIDQALSTIYDENLRRTCAAWTGAKDEVSLGQMATNCFFALSYKNRMIQPLVQGMRSLLSPDENMQRFSYWGKEFITDSTTDFSLSGNGMMNNLGTQFMQRGNRNMIGMVAAISAIAFISAKSLGLATSWDDLSFTDEDDLDENGNPTFKVPEILKKFQTIGQIWLPNAWDENGNPYVDPRKPQYTIDSFSSMFTLPNTAWKTIDRTFNANDYYTAPQRGIGLLGQMTGANPQGINDFLNTPLMRAVGDELIGSNLLSPYKAMYEVLMDSSYYGNNIWEKRYLRDGSENPNYDPLRNVQASFMHILGLDEVLDKRGYNRWVKGYYTNDYVDQDQVGTIAGSGILQHEYFTMLKQFINGQMIEGIVEGGELPIKKRTLSSTARTEFNTKVKNIIAQYMKQYRDVADNTTDADVKDEAYAKAVKQSADAVAAWSKKYSYVLGRDQKLVPYVTRSMMAMLAGEYDDNLDYIQNTYWKASAIAQIEATGPEGFWLGDEDFDAWAESGKTAEEFAAEKNKRHDAYNKALDDEYKARKALHDAGIDNEYLAGLSVQNLKAEQRAVNKEVYTGALRALESQVGEFKNFKEMKSYYESQIEAASSTKQKAKLANQYNKYVTDALAPYVSKYGAGIIADGYYNHDYLSNALAEYIIIPADKYYTGKTPRASYLKDLFGVGYRNKSNLPSDDEVIEGYAQARKQMVEGYSASSAAILDRVIDAIKRGRLYVSDSDYSKIVRMRALLNARSK